MNIFGSLARIVAVSILIFIVTIEKGVVLGGYRRGASKVFCKYGDYPCDDGKKCYSEAQKCDAKKDCDDNSDEDVHHCDHDNWPEFKIVECHTVTQDGKYTRCYEVTFPGDGIKDHMLLEKVPDAFETYQGRFKEERGGTVPVAFNDPDTEDGETEAGAAFHSLHVATCSKFLIDVTTSPHKSTCIKQHATSDAGAIKGDELTGYGEYEPRGASAKLNPKGYRVKVKVYYDDAMAKAYSEAKVKQKLRSVMVYVEEMFHERDTLTTIVQICAKSIKIERAPQGNNWVEGMSRLLGVEIGRVVRSSVKSSKEEANLYVFVTARGSGSPLGVAYVGTVCKTDPTYRVSLSRYGIAGSQKNKVLYTAETIAHEMGHNLGMRHDFDRTDSRGKSCYGYMDYKDDTNYWSTCSVEDFTKTKKSCLAAASSECSSVPIDDEEDDEGENCVDSKKYAKYCKKFTWACKDSRYPWFKEQCKKTCNTC